MLLILNLKSFYFNGDGENEKYFWLILFLSHQKLSIWLTRPLSNRWFISVSRGVRPSVLTSIRVLAIPDSFLHDQTNVTCLIICVMPIRWDHSLYFFKQEMLKKYILFTEICTGSSYPTLTNTTITLMMRLFFLLFLYPWTLTHYSN